MTSATKVLSILAVAALMAGCNDVTSPSHSPTRGPAPARGGRGIAKSYARCDSGCTSNYNGTDLGADTIWIAIGQTALITPLAGDTGLVLGSVVSADPKTGITSFQRVGTTQLSITVGLSACANIANLMGASCLTTLRYVADPANPASQQPPVQEAITVIMFNAPASTMCNSNCASLGDTVWMQIGQSAVVTPLPGDSTMVLASVAPADPKTGLQSVQQQGLTQIAIQVGRLACTDLSPYSRGVCSTRVAYVAARLGHPLLTTQGSLTVIMLNTPPAINGNASFSVSITAPGIPETIAISQFASDVNGQPLTLTAVSTPVSIPGFSVSIVNNQVAVTRTLAFFGMGMSVPVQVTVSDGITTTTGTITLHLA